MEKYLIRAKEILNENGKDFDAKEFSTCLRRMTMKERHEFNMCWMEKYHPDFLAKMKGDLNFKSKVIASYIRSNMEEFHYKHLSDAQMKELNTIIRNSIYTALKDIDDEKFLKAYSTQLFNISPDWEECEYVK